MKKVKTLQMGKKLYILDGVSPMRYVDLEANELHVFKPIKLPTPKELYQMAAKTMERKK